MILATTPEIAGKRIFRTLGLARGNCVCARRISRDVLAQLRNLVRGEMQEYTKLPAESREQALDPMVEDARLMGAHAVVGVGFVTAMLAQGMAKLLAYGTAVVVEDE